MYYVYLFPFLSAIYYIGVVSISNDAKRPVRVAIIGYGLAGAVFHAPLVSSTPGMVVTAIVTNNIQRRERAQHDLPQAAILASADELWSNASNYDLVIVAAANKVHVPLAVAAMRAGLPVVIDKPFAPTVAAAEELFAVSKETGKWFTVFQNRRWDNDFLTVRKLLNADLLGPITRFESRFERYRAQPRLEFWRESGGPEEAGGLLYDLGSHLIDQALQLFGTPLTVYAEMDQRRDGARTDDDTFVALHFANDVRAHLWMSVVARNPAPRVRLSGLRGTYEKWGLDPQEEALKEGRRPGMADWGKEPSERWGKLTTDIGGLPVTATVETVAGAYEHYYQQVYAALVDNAPLPVDPEDALNALRVIEAAQQSATTSAVVQFGS